jgi:very-short-patch-repair endonuclease
MGEDYWTLDGLRISSPARVWCELAVLLSMRELVAAGDFLIHWRSPLVSREQLTAAARRYPDRRGRVSRRAALEHLDARSESPKESELRTILAVGGIRGLVSNLPVRVGGANYRLDLALPESKIDIEYQGDYHRDPAQWRRDMSRRSRLEADGWAVIELNADDLNNPAELLARIHRIMRVRTHPSR